MLRLDLINFKRSETEIDQAVGERRPQDPLPHQTAPRAPLLCRDSTTILKLFTACNRIQNLERRGEPEIWPASRETLPQNLHERLEIPRQILHASADTPSRSTSVFLYLLMVVKPNSGHNSGASNSYGLRSNRLCAPLCEGS